MNNTNILPTELEQQIDTEATNKTMKLPANNSFDVGYMQGMESGYIAGATEYATKYQQAKQLLDALIDLRDSDIAPSAFIKANNELFIKIKSFLDGSHR